ncbi:hypothetical protein VTK26DRAFT_6924 [Humicola hyalothermophila]
MLSLSNQQLNKRAFWKLGRLQACCNEQRQTEEIRLCSVQGNKRSLKLRIKIHNPLGGSSLLFGAPRSPL